ncbi:SDR family oxidoreductase [bacterium LRH843]|nr:SDR family oxidoreductase [bacterium LRH843]
MKWIIVTGDSRGVGHEIAKSLLEHTTFGVIGLSRTTSDHINELVSIYNDRYRHINFDLSNPDSIKDLYLSSLKKIGPIYGLVNNSAYAYDDLATNAKHDELENMFTINVISPILLTKYVIRDMLLHQMKGSIVHISSVCAHTGYKGLSMYASTKGALEAFSKGISREWGGVGIRSNCIAPGFMDTAMSSSLDTKQKTRIYNRTSLRKSTDLKSVADTAIFLLSEKSSSITGAVLHVDSGTI